MKKLINSIPWWPIAVVIEVVLLMLISVNI